MNYFFQVIIDAQIYLLLAVSLSFLIRTGLLQINHAAYYGFGAYTSALSSLKLGMSFGAATLTASALTAFLSVASSAPMLRLRPDAFIMMALAVQATVYAFLYNASSLTGGPIGLSGIPKPHLGGFTFSTDAQIACLYFPILGISLAVIGKLMKSPFGSALIALRDDEVSARSVGIPTRRRKLQAIAIGSAFAGLAGSLYAHQANAIDPTSFTLDLSILLVAICAIGGVATIGGQVIAVALLIGTQESLRFTFQVSTAANIRLLLFGALLTLVAVRSPDGLIKEANVT